MEKIILELKTKLGNETFDELTKNKIISCDEDSVKIELKKSICQLYESCFEIEINTDGKNADVNMFYLNYTGDLGKINIVYYGEDNTMIIVDKNKITVQDDKLFIDNKYVDFDDYDSNIYEIDREETFTEQEYFNIGDFKWALKNYPFSKKYEEDDGAYYLKSVKINEKKLSELIVWLKSVIQ